MVFDSTDANYLCPCEGQTRILDFLFCPLLWPDSTLGASEWTSLWCGAYADMIRDIKNMSDEEVDAQLSQFRGE
jgi:hypothetical protein